MDTEVDNVQRKIKYISNDAATHQELLRELALLDYRSDKNAYKREGEQIIIDAMKESGMTDREIENVLNFKKN